MAQEPNDNTPNVTPSEATCCNATPKPTLADSAPAGSASTSPTPANTEPTGCCTSGAGSSEVKAGATKQGQAAETETCCSAPVEVTLEAKTSETNAPAACTTPPVPATETAPAATTDTTAAATTDAEALKAMAEKPAVKSGNKILIGSQRADDKTGKPESQSSNYPPPNIRGALSDELQAEYEAALGDGSLNEIVERSTTAAAGTTELGQGSKVQCKVVKIHREEIFVEFAGHNQGMVQLKQFKEAPEIGSLLELTISRLNAEEGLYELAVATAAVSIGNWDEVEVGKIVEVLVTGSNKGGLECQISGIRGFIPMGQISIAHVEKPEEFVGQKLTCLITEAKQARKNLVLSPRAVQERERAEQREKLIQTLEVGQTHEGTVRKLMDFGAFVDIGGIDGLIHISKMSWDRIRHPNEVLTEGQAVKVKIEKIDAESGKIGFSYRDASVENPWANVGEKYILGSSVKGTVSKVMDFGGFIKLEPGVEGLVHVSEIAHRRVWKPSDELTEGQEVQVKILSVDLDAQRISLSMKALIDAPASKEGEAKIEFPKDAPQAPKKKHKTLKGGTGNSSGQGLFGLNL